MGRGLLFGQAAQGEIRVRTGAHAQLPAFRQCAQRRRFLCGQPSFRNHADAAHGHSRFPPRRADLRGERRRRPPPRTALSGLLRPQGQTRRRVVLAPARVFMRRRAGGAAAGDHQLQLLACGRRQAEAAVDLRGQDPLPRIRTRSGGFPLARAVSAGDGQLPARHGRTALAAERALGLGAGGDETLRPRLRDGASDSRCADREVQGVGELPEGALPDRFLCHRAARPRMAHRAAAGRRVRRGGFRTGVPETLRLPGAYRFTLPDDLLQPHLRQQLPRAVLLLHVVGGAGHRCLRGIHRHGRYFRFRNRAPLPPPYPDRSGL